MAYISKWENRNSFSMKNRFIFSQDLIVSYKAVGLFLLGCEVSGILSNSIFVKCSMVAFYHVEGCMSVLR